MQRQSTGYTFDTDGNELTFDFEKFKEDVELIGSQGYESDQIFDGGRILKYKTIVLFGITDERLAQVKQIYKIEPSDTITRGDIVNYVFKFVGTLTINRFNNLGKKLAELYQAEFRHFSINRFNADKVHESGKFIQEMAINGLFGFSTLCDTVNENEELNINDLPIGDVLKKLKTDLEYDDVLNIVPLIGSPFNVIENQLGSVQAAMLWCNKNFDGKFFTEDAEISSFIIEGIIPRCDGDIVQSNGGYSILTEKGQSEITDFLIAVHYLLIKADGENVYIVSLIPRKGKRIEHIEWKNVSSDTNLADFIMRFGALHYKGTKKGVVALHQMITASKVPVIHTYPQYGAAVYKGTDIIICRDAVFDMDTQKVFPRNEKFGFYFIGGNDGIMISNETEAGKIQKELIPKIGTVTNNKYEDYYKMTGQLYRNNTGHILLMYACSMAGISLYHRGNKTPSYYVTGVTGSGKTSFSEILYSMFGVDEGYGLRNSTAYPVKTIISAFNRLPVFFNEFRSDMKYATDKLGYIQMAYDNSTTSKGLRQGGTVSYKMTSQVFCEGEDTYNEGSIRTRSILHTLTRAGMNIGCVPKDIIHENKQLIESFFGTYATHTIKQDYDAALREARGLFYRNGVEPRISDNISIMYAGCVSFSPENKDIFIENCNYLIDSQMSDFRDNGESQKVIRVLAEYYGNKFCNVYLELGYLYVDWVEITAYMERFKKNLTLSTGAYRGHMESLGFEPGFFEIEAMTEEFGVLAHSSFKMIEGFRMPIVDLPKNLLNNPRIYSEYRKARLAVENKKLLTV